MSNTNDLDVQFHYTLWDRVRVGYVMLFRSWVGALSVLIFPITGLVLFSIYVYKSIPIKLDVGVVIAMSFLFTPAFSLFSAIYGHYFGQRAGKPYNYQFGTFGLRAYDDTTELTQSWKAICEIRRRGGFLLLFFTAKCAHCLPYRALKKMGAVEPIVELARAHGIPVRGI